MKAKRATEILRCLVQGIDPTDGSEVPSGASVLNKPEVIRALLLAIGAVEEKSARDARRATLPANVGHTWTAEEEQALARAFQAGDPVAEISQRLGRTVRAIEARLVRLGFLSPDQRTTSSEFIPNG